MMGSTIKLRSESKKEYIDKHIESAYQYERDVLSGKIKASKWIKLAIARRKTLGEKYYFNIVEVKKVLQFFYYIRLTIGGQVRQFQPLPWQCWITLNMYGYYRDSKFKKRLFRYINIWVARKSAKTTLAAIYSLYDLTQGERNSEVYFCATTKEQASQALKYLKQITNDTPALRARITPNKKARRVDIRRYHLEHTSKERGACTAKPVANEPKQLDGLSPSFVIVDEKHALPNNDLFNIMKTGTLARENPQIVTISTAGFDMDYPYYRELELGKKVLEGSIEDDSTFYAFYTLDSETEIDDPEMWEKSNPSFKDGKGNGVIWLDDMIVDYKKACLTLSDKKNFITKNLNIYIDGADAWIETADYNKCVKPINMEELKGCKAYLGLDLSTVRDLSSLVVVVEHPKTGEIQIIPEFYFPSDKNSDGIRTSINKIRESGIDLGDWIDSGHIIEHEEKVINYDKIYDRIAYFCDYFDVQAIGYDPWNSHSLISKVEENILVDLVPCKQNTGFYNFPMKYFERLIYSEDINVSDNPVLRWNVRNVITYIDGNGNVKPMKNKSLDSIDGVVSALMALGMYANINFDAIAALMEDLNKKQ